MKIQIIYGTETGTTESVLPYLLELLEKHQVDVTTIDKLHFADNSPQDLYILSSPTWYNGELSSDWTNALESFKNFNFKDRKFALFGLGNQEDYPDDFVSGMGILAQIILKGGGEIVGLFPYDTYNFKNSKAICIEGYFYGLGIDEDCQPEQTKSRFKKWVKIIEKEFNLS